MPFCVLDLETTGGSPKDCEITEVGAVKYVGGEPVGTFHSIVNPGIPIPPYIQVLTGITQLMVVEAPKIGEVLPSLLEFIGDAVIVGHNVRFDMSFLNAAAERLGYGRLPNRTADTAALARRLCRQEVRNLKLGTLAAHFRSPTTPNHRALEDAKATAHVFWALLERAGALGVTHLDDLFALPTAKGHPQYGKLSLTESLPRRPGVYLFRDRQGNVIYVGKAKDLRARVRSYFYGDTRKRVGEMLKVLETIDHRVCAHELEAEVTEIRLIHAHAPRYNRRSRPARSPHWLRLTKERLPRLSLVRRPDRDAWFHLGPFRSRRHAAVVMTALWDAVPLRRCTGKGGKATAACSFAQLGVARCPCRGNVTEAEYREIVEGLVFDLEHRPGALLDRLVDRMRAHVTQARFEEAADVRDRYRALAGALERRREWQALQRVGVLRAESVDGDGVIVDHGVLAAAWRRPDPAPLFGIDPTNAPAASTEVAPSPEAAEEAHLIWRWLARPDVELVDATGPLALPAAPIPVLDRLSA